MIVLNVVTDPHTTLNVNPVFFCNSAMQDLKSSITFITTCLSDVNVLKVVSHSISQPVSKHFM